MKSKTEPSTYVKNVKRNSAYSADVIGIKERTAKRTRINAKKVGPKRSGSLNSTLEN
jgi:hypothetical protein